MLTVVPRSRSTSSRAAPAPRRRTADGCISWDATSGGWPLRVRKFRVEYDWNHAKFVWMCGADGVDVRGRPTLVISVLLTGAQAHAWKQRLAWETPRGGTSLILSSVSFLSCWILEALGGVFRSWLRSLFGGRRLLAYSVMTVVACWTGCVDGRRTWSDLRSSATWKDELSGGGKRGAGEGHLKRELR